MIGDSGALRKTPREAASEWCGKRPNVITIRVSSVVTQEPRGCPRGPVATVAGGSTATTATMET
jgi:hypothetical protein